MQAQADKVGVRTREPDEIFDKAASHDESTHPDRHRKRVHGDSGGGGRPWEAISSRPALCKAGLCKWRSDGRGGFVSLKLFNRKGALGGLSVNLNGSSGRCFYSRSMSFDCSESASSNLVI